MERLFNRALIFTDIHWGKHNNDKTHNNDCMEFVEWAIDMGKEFDVDCCIFLGDWHDNRHSIHVSTLNSSYTGLSKINNGFKTTYFIPGNHDLFYKDRRDMSSIIISNNFENIHLIQNMLPICGVLFVPWLISDEWKDISSHLSNTKYVMGHFELPNFLMNANMEMKDNNTINADHFKNINGLVLSGHFHKRQRKNNVIYIGNAFPQTFSDVWDDDRGITILDWDEEPVFVPWSNSPKYRSFDLTEALDSPDDFLSERLYAKINNNINISQEEQHFIKEVFTKIYNTRRLDFIPFGDFDDQEGEIGDAEYKSIDDLVVEGLKMVDSSTIEIDLLIEIYLGL